jgi:alginate O-acetyltransferase complex protein AlgI
LAAPLGISYASIRIADLLIASRAGVHLELRPLEYISFLFFPATLAAGPVLTLDRFRSGRISCWGVTDVAAGAARFAVGLAKKSIADAYLAPLVASGVDTYLAAGANMNSSALATMLVADMIYIYLEFSGYTDMAIGAGRSLGWRLPENFNWSLLQPGIRAYWRNWHMSLSEWAFRRVYFPVLLNARSQHLATIATMLLIGLWHVPRTTWALWAIHHTAGLIVEAFVVAKISSAIMSSQFCRHMPLIAVFARVLGVAFVWTWVSLGHAFTLFSEPGKALAVYVKILGVVL